METVVAPPSATTSTETIVLGKYRLGRLLGRGGSAKVYDGVSTKDETPVAIKIIDKSKLDPSSAPRIVCEVSAMRRLNHPNIIHIEEVLATKSKIYLVMELATGGDLRDKILDRPDRRLPEPMACRYFHQIVSALEFCHRHGVVHRDIKPENILLDANGHVKVTDFGLSAIANDEGELPLLKTACGTPVFAAPEVVTSRRGGGYDGAKADAWSCGVLLYTILVGSLPFDYRNLAMMCRKAHLRQFGFPSHVSRPARGMVYKLLDPNPRTRLRIEDITKDAWFRSTQFGPRSVSLGDLVSSKETEFYRVLSMNAFDIIGRNSALDLSGLFDDGIGKKERWFTSKLKAEEVAERVVEVGGKLGYDVEKGKGGKILLGRGKLVLVVEVLELGPELLVELRVVQGGGCGPCGGGGAGGACGGHGGGVGEGQWEEIKDGLGDVVDAWQCP